MNVANGVKCSEMAEFPIRVNVAVGELNKQKEMCEKNPKESVSLITNRCIKLVVVLNGYWL